MVEIICVKATGVRAVRGDWAAEKRRPWRREMRKKKIRV